MTDSSSPATLLDVVNAAPGSRTALLIPETGARVTYESLRRQIARAADTFAGAGIQKGDRIAMALGNGPAVIVSFLAASVAGTAAPLNPAYRYEEFSFYLEDTNARLLVLPAEAPSDDPARRAAAQRNIPILTAETDASGEVRILGAAGHRSASEPSPDDVALILHTSGSTGRPKRVPLKHVNLAVSTRNVADTYRLSPDDVSLCLMPLFHVHGLVASTLATLFSGGAVAVPARFNPLSFWRTVRDSNATWYSAVPTIHQLILARSASGQPSDTRRLRFVRSCSAPLAVDTAEKLEALFGAPVLEAYG
ncbi:MAG TPA: AMP-binding protein, partial [Bryobacteraceae bacterium]|nr:AMP-binding protein [Bryobacteraceae bacterium]